MSGANVGRKSAILDAPQAKAQQLGSLPGVNSGLGVACLCANPLSTTINAFLCWRAHLPRE
jgi:hypothetical protein